MIDKDGRWKSDKYPTCPADKVPLSVNDVSAQDLLWEYAHRRRRVDAEFSDDLQARLKTVGYRPVSHRPSSVDLDRTACGLPLERFPIDRDIQLGAGETWLCLQSVL
jgi:hypothetical protein